MEERRESKLKRFLKKSSTKDRIGLLALVWILGSLVFITIVDYALDPDTFTDPVKRNAWLTKTLLMMGLIIYGLFYAESVATDLVKKNPDGLYQKNLEKFLAIRLQVNEHIQFFADWFVWYKASELEQKKIDFLIGHGIMEAQLILNNIDDIDLSELMEHPVMIDGKIIRKKTEQQCSAIRMVKEGKITIDTFGTAYYLSQDLSAKDSYILESGLRLEKAKRENIVFSRLFKIGVSIIVSVVFAAFSFKDFKENDINAWVNLVTRIGGLLGGIASGLRTGTTTAKFEASKLANKCDVLTLFEKDLETGRYKPKSYEELALQEEKEYESTRTERTDTSLLEEQATISNA